MPASCQIVQEQLDAYARSGLRPDQRGLVERHLRDCAGCRHGLALAQLLTSARPGLPPLVPAGFAGEVARAWAGQRPRDRLRRSLRAGRHAAVRLAWCALVDPFLRVDYQVRGALEQIRDPVLAPLHLIRALLAAQLAATGRLALAPLQHSSALIYRLASGHTN